MGALIFKKLDIKVKIALVYSLVLLLMGVAIVAFLSLALQQSMKNQPVTSNIENLTYSIAVKEEGGSVITYEIPRQSDTTASIAADAPGQYASTEGKYSITGDQLNNFLSSEVFKRLLRYSAIAVAVLLVGTFFLSYNLSRWLLKPLTSMAKVTHRITAENLDLRLDIPESDDELKELTTSFNTTLDGLQEAFNELERFNAYASHELKNALAVMKTRLEVDYREGDCRETVSFAISQVNRISKSINDILAISSTGIKDSKELVDLAMAAAQVVDEYRVTGRDITLEIPEEGVLPVRGKEIWFQRVIANLVDNAVKHTGCGCPIRVSVKQRHGAVIVSVSDSGGGIDRSEQDLIWKPYFSTDAEEKRGYGLGLAMVNHIVDICGGLVWVDSRQGQGSTFYISLPAAGT
jgi:signal transduction histidine kinase